MGIIGGIITRIIIPTTEILIMDILDITIIIIRVHHHQDQVHHLDIMDLVNN